MRVPRRKLAVAAGIGALGVAALAGSSVALGDQDGHVMHVVGSADFVRFTEGCDSPVGDCATGVYRGVLHGDSVNKVSAYIPSDPSDMTFAQETEVIHMQGGDLHSKISAAVHAVPGGEIASIHRITGGTGDFEGATGAFQLLGNITADGAEATYVGDIELP